MGMAERYPKSEVHAFDNVPRWETRSTEIPDNLSLFEHDYRKPLEKFPDNSFNVVRLGTLSGGVSLVPLVIRPVRLTITLVVYQREIR